jgi:hypothetical protein
MRIAVVKWAENDGVSDAIRSEFERLGHQVEDFLFDHPVPSPVALVLTFAPWGRFIPIASQIGQMPRLKRPVFVHWNLEAPPDSSIPWPITKFLSDIRLGVDLLNDAQHKTISRLRQSFPLSWINQDFHRFRFVGEYFYSHRKGWLDILCDTSFINVQYWRSHGLPAEFIPWGLPSDWYADLSLPRDIGVLWMGHRRNWYRSTMIDTVKKEMCKRGISMYVADGLENPFIHGAERTEILNRSIITLNIQSERKKNILPMRFTLAAGNRSCVLSETTLAHVPEIIDNEHYVSTPSNLLIEKILYYLENQQERQSIIQNAYHLTTTRLTMANSLKIIIDKVEQYKFGMLKEGYA